MSLKNTLTAILGSVILGVSSPFVGNSYAQSERVQGRANPVEYIELSEKNPSFSREFPVDLYQRQAAKSVGVGKTVVSVQGELDYNSGKFMLSYSSGRVTEDGPDLSRFSSKERETLPAARLAPRLTDNETDMYFVSVADSSSKNKTLVSLPKGVDLSKGVINAEDLRREGLEGSTVVMTSSGPMIEVYTGKSPVIKPVEMSQRGYFYPEDEVRPLIKLEEHWEKKLLMEKGREGLDKLIEYGDSYVPDVPFADRIKPLRRLHDYFVKVMEQEKESGRQDAARSLENAVASERIPLFVDSGRGIAPKHMIARMMEFDLKNSTFQDQPVSVYIKKIGIGDRDVAYGEVRDVAIVLNLPSSRKDYLGKWMPIESFVNGEKEDLRERAKEEGECIFFKVSEKDLTILAGEEVDGPREISKWFQFNEKDMALLFFDDLPDNTVLIRKVSPNKIVFAGPNRDLEDTCKMNKNELDACFEEGRIIFERVK